MFSNILISQCVGSLSIPLVLVQNQLSRKRDFLLLNALNGILYCVQLGLLSEYSGAFLGLMPVFTSLFYATTHRDPSRTTKWLLGLAVTGVAWVMTPHATAWWWWLPLVGFAIARTAEAMHDTHAMRHVFLVSACVWGVYALFCNAWAALIMDVVAILSNLIWLVRNKKTSA